MYIQYKIGLYLIFSLILCRNLSYFVSHTPLFWESSQRLNFYDCSIGFTVKTRAHLILMLGVSLVGSHHIQIIGIKS